jgi:rhamnogalacturonyl hydrolase YesR
MRSLSFAFLLALTTGILHAQVPRGEEYLPLTDDGAWCWFSDPRAVYSHGSLERLYAGWASARGDVVVGSYHYVTGTIHRTIVQAGLQKDDHISPSLLTLPDGRIMVFFSGHNGPTYCATSIRPDDITDFEPARKIEAGETQCYTNPVLLSEEHNRIYLFFRGGKDWKPAFVTSDDLGRTWSAAKGLVAKPGATPLVRPYVKIVTDGRSKIHFAFTDGHPRDEPTNSIYYMLYEDGVFSDAAGNRLGTLTNLPVDQDKVPRVYDGASERVRAWVWDIAYDAAGRPIVVFTTLPEESKHEYRYSSWNGTAWTNHFICQAGSWFPRVEKLKEEREPEPHYSGGICLNHEDPSVVYLSRPHHDIFEIERWQTSDGGKHWSQTMVTEFSRHDNVRPVAVAGCPPGLSPSLLWMNASRYRHYTNYQASIVANRPAPGFPVSFKKDDITKIMSAVAEWQMKDSEKPKHHELDWTNGALYRGIFAWARLTHDQRGMKWLEDIGSRFAWQPYSRMYVADDIAVAQTFLDLYRLKKDQRMLDPTRARIDYVIAHPARTSMMLDYSVPSTLDRWSWCDALFMAPPVYAKLAAITGDEKYLKFMQAEYEATVKLLYDNAEHLFARDYRFLAQREENGKKIFWGRGNGWVIGGLVSILKDLPAQSRYRSYYESLFNEMAAKVASVQDTSGFWHASLLDPASYPNPETSCTGFFCYALAYGVNAGLLARGEYFPHVKKAWEALVKSVSSDGKLGWVQPIGEDPKKVDRSMTEVYGVGAFLLAGSEVWGLAE